MPWYQRTRDPQEQRGFLLIGALVYDKRIALSWTQRMLEAVSGIDQTVISRIENGKQYGLRWSRFALLVDALGGLGPATPRGPWPGLANVSPIAPDPIGNRSQVIDLASGPDVWDENEDEDDAEESGEAVPAAGDASANESGDRIPNGAV